MRSSPLQLGLQTASTLSHCPDHALRNSLRTRRTRLAEGLQRTCTAMQHMRSALRQAHHCCSLQLPLNEANCLCIQCR